MAHTRGDFKAQIVQTRINTLLGSLLLGSLALWAGLTMWHVATGTDPLAKAFAATIFKQTTLPE